MSTSEKAIKIGEWAKKNQGDIALVAGFVLVALISFGLGYLSAPGVSKSELKIQDLQSDISQTAVDAVVGDGAAVNMGNSQPSTEKGTIVASKYGTKYHWPWCSFAKNIKPENEVWFKTEAEAKAAGYSACGCIKSKAPAGYTAQ
ncbi:MAG: hypothetical protein V1845_01035 [bacterium]